MLPLLLLLLLLLLIMILMLLLLLLILLLLLLPAVAVLGEVCSGASVAAAGVSNAKKLPIISPSSTSPSLSQPDFFFRVVSSVFIYNDPNTTLYFSGMWFLFIAGRDLGVQCQAAAHQ
jgi:hypothetical protein